MKKYLFILIIIPILTVPIISQSISNLSKNLPCLEKEFNIQTFVTVDSIDRSPLLSQQDIDDIFDKASVFFDPICFSFKSCTYDVLENYTYGNLIDSLRRNAMIAQNVSSQRLTVFFVNTIQNNSKCGYSQYNTFNTRNKNSIIIELLCQDRPEEQLAHHVGSILGLLDTNNTVATELVDGSNCSTAGDQICDTPADPFGAIRNDDGQWVALPEESIEKYNEGCLFTWETLDNNGDFFNPSTSNIMSPYPCKCQFTYEQFQVMIRNYRNSFYRQY